MNNIFEPEKLTPKDPSEIVPIVWEFDDPAVVVSAVSATATTYEGVDISPSVILGSATFTANKATVIVTGGIHGVTYKIKVAITLAGGNKFVYTVLLPVFSL